MTRTLVERETRIKHKQSAITFSKAKVKFILTREKKLSLKRESILGGSRDNGEIHLESSAGRSWEVAQEVRISGECLLEETRGRCREKFCTNNRGSAARMQIICTIETTTVEEASFHSTLTRLADGKWHRNGDSLIHSALPT